MLNDVTQLEQEIKALEKEKEYFKDWCKVYESRIETKDHIINQLEKNRDEVIEYIKYALDEEKETPSKHNDWRLDLLEILKGSDK